MKNELREKGFQGFISIKELIKNSSCIPEERGVYIVIRENTENPNFLTTGTGGFFKSKDPNVSIEELKKNWVNSSAIMYIGKAGSITNDEDKEKSKKRATLKSRIRQYLKFGQGHSVGHQGGRYIWQLKDSLSLLICWKELPEQNPREIERQMILDFKKHHEGRRPFANLQD